MKTIETRLEEFDKKFCEKQFYQDAVSFLTIKSDTTPEKIKSFLHQSLTQQLEEIEQMIVDEILICHKENTPTSRLTSLMMKVKELKK